MHTMFNTLSFILRHPLNRSRRFTALRRFLYWQVGSRLLPGAVAVPFVDNSRLLVTPGMTGATGNIYCGLHEFEDMALVLHALRPGDLFVDVGANVGAYTVLAAGGAGAHVLAIEPIPATFVHLIDNIRLNGLETMVQAENVGVWAVPGTLQFSTGFDCTNHVVTEAESSLPCVEVRVDTLDALLGDRVPALIKIDVEGFETEVINGAKHALESQALLGVIMELNGSGIRYGFDDQTLHGRMLKTGFRPFRYDPFEKVLTAIHIKNVWSGNTLYVRDEERLQARVQSTPAHRVHGVML
jgi:FkbM family methyltransferase